MLPDHKCSRKAETASLYSKVPHMCPRQAENANSTSGSSKKQYLLEAIKGKMEGKEVRLAAGDSEFQQKSCCSDNRGEQWGSTACQWHIILATKEWRCRGKACKPADELQSAAQSGFLLLERLCKIQSQKLETFRHSVKRTGCKTKESVLTNSD